MKEGNFTIQNFVCVLKHADGSHMKTVIFYRKLIKVFFMTSLQGDIAFRADFAAKLFNTAIMLSGSIGGILIMFSVHKSFKGWGFYDMLAVTGTFMLIQSLKELFISPSLSSISGMDGELWTGGFDYTLLKPVSTRFYVSIRHWSPMAVFDIIISIILLLISVFESESPKAIGSTAAFLAYLLVAMLILYSLMLLLASAAFWYLGTPLLWILNSLMSLGRYPVKIYPVLFRNLLTWVIPVGVIVTLPAEILLGRASVIEITGGVVLGLILYAVAVLFFKASLKRYSSASS